MTNYPGLFITLEGIDGSGKSTQAKLLQSYLEEHGASVVMVREPGGTKISEAIRALLLNAEYTEMSDTCELLLLESSRAQLTEQVIMPALKRGEVVVADRYFDSTFAYQAGARGLPEDLIHRANAMGSCGLTPDITLFFDVDVQVAFERVAATKFLDRMEREGLEFMEKVRAGYQRLVELDSRVIALDATGDPSEIAESVQVILHKRLKELDKDTLIQESHA